MIDYKSLEVGDLTAASINSNIHKGTIVKGIIYDTSKDSDGGAWRKRMQDKSWYNETLGGTNWLGQVSTAALAWAAPGAVTGSYFQNSTDGLFYQLGASSPTVTQVYRGNVREFPAVVAIVAESSRVVIYDLTQSGAPMWFVAKVTFITSLAAMQGRLVVGRGPASNMLNIEFVKDYLWSINNIGTTGLVDLIGSTPVHTWTGLTTYAQDTSRLIVSASVNDVAITVLDTAPIDPATGLPVPTIAVATAGGVSVISDSGTVANSSSTAAAYGIFIDEQKRLNWGYLANSVVGLQLSSSVVNGFSAGFLLVSVGTAYSGTQLPLAISGGNNTGKNSKGAFANNQGINLHKLGSNAAQSMIAGVTNTYTSGWLPGDIRGAYLADTTAETITASGELVLTPDFATDTNWTKTGTATISGGVASIPADASGIYQSTATVVGRTYVYTATVVTANASLVFYVGLNGTGAQMLDTGNVTTTGAKVYTFVAQSSTSFIRVVNFSTGGVTAVIDNISVKLAEPDRSVKNTGLVVNGTLTKTAVASGAGLVAYSGFSAANLLTQPYSANMDFGSAEFCVIGWFNVGATTANLRIGKGAVAATSWYVSVDNLGDVYFINSNSTAYVKFAGAAPSGSMTLVCIKRTSTAITASFNGRDYIVGTAIVGTIFSNTLTESAPLTIDSVSANSGSLALVRISGTAPSADQIAHIYRTELPLFQANAQCTLAGTSSAVTALAYDDVADELHVGTSWGRSEFRDLVRVASEATTTGSITSLSANEGVVLTGGTSAKVYAPAMYLREELRRKDVARKALGRIPVFFDYTATASQTAFVAPKGFTVKALYKNGTLMREATTGVYWTRSNDGFQETATLSVGATVSDWISLMCVRV